MSIANQSLNKQTHHTKRSESEMQSDLSLEQRMNMFHADNEQIRASRTMCVVRFMLPRLFRLRNLKQESQTKEQSVKTNTPRLVGNTPHGDYPPLRTACHDNSDVAETSLSSFSNNDNRSLDEKDHSLISSIQSFDDSVLEGLSLTNSTSDDGSARSSSHHEHLRHLSLSSIKAYDEIMRDFDDQEGGVDYFIRETSHGLLVPQNSDRDIGPQSCTEGSLDHKQNEEKKEDRICPRRSISDLLRHYDEVLAGDGGVDDM